MGGLLLALGKEPKVGRRPGIFKQWRKGERITAARLDKMSRGIDLLTGGVNPPTQITNAGVGVKTLTKIKRFQVIEVQRDYIDCYPFVGGGNGVDNKQKYRIALPYQLRRSPFDGETRDSVTYEYTSATERTATSGSIEETQIIIPPYVTGDVIFAARGIDGGTGVNVGTTTTPKYLEWQDCNFDGRAWAHQSEGF